MASPKIIFSIAAAIILLFLAADVANDLPDKQKASEGHAAVVLYSETGEQLKIRAEVADTDEERATGLMFRETLGGKEGMLFIYQEAAVVNFWMKNTLIPLDMVFISEDFTVVKIHHSVPCTEEPCQLYNSGQPIKYALEINENFTTAYGIREGSSVEIIW